MTMEYVVTTHHPDATVSHVWFGDDSKGAQKYARTHGPAIRAAGGNILVGIDRRIPDGRTHCPTCHGSGSVVTRHGGEGGMFPDEDACPDCYGAGHVGCRHCNDTGLTPATDPYGEYAGDEHCTCDTGRALYAEMVAESARVDAEAADQRRREAEWESAGMDLVASVLDDLNAQPF